MVTTTRVSLTDHELVWLTGHCSSEVQAEVDKAHRRIETAKLYDLPNGLAGLVADVISEARENGRLIYQSERVRYCSYCNQDPGYYIYKSGYNKGFPNRSKPLYLYGTEMAQRFIVTRGRISLGACSDCMAVALPAIKAALVGIPVALPPTLQTEGERLWERHENRECTSCGWVGHEGDMGRLRTLMGNGTYPGICPACKAKNDVFGPQIIKPVAGFTVVPVVPEEPDPIAPPPAIPDPF